MTQARHRLPRPPEERGEEIKKGKSVKANPAKPVFFFFSLSLVNLKKKLNTPQEVAADSFP